MSANDLVMRARVLAESLFQDTFMAYAPGGTAEDERGMEIPGYDDRGAVLGKVAGTSRQSRDTAARTIRIGNVDVTVIEAGLHIPVSAPVPDSGQYGVGWEYELIEPGPMTDPALKGTRWLVVSAPSKSYMTARRFDIAQIPSQQVSEED